MLHEYIVFKCCKHVKSDANSWEHASISLKIQIKCSLLLHPEANIRYDLYSVQLLHVVALSEKHGVFLIVYLLANQLGIHDTLIYQRQETSVSISQGVFVEVKVWREPGDLPVQRLQFSQVILDRHEGSPDPDAVLILVGIKILLVGTAQLAQRVPVVQLLGLKIKRPFEVIVTRRHLERFSERQLERHTLFSSFSVFLYREDFADQLPTIQRSKQILTLLRILDNYRLPNVNSRPVIKDDNDYDSTRIVAWLCQKVTWHRADSAAPRRG